MRRRCLQLVEVVSPKTHRAGVDRFSAPSTEEGYLPRGLRPKNNFAGRGLSLQLMNERCCPTIADRKRLATESHGRLWPLLEATQTGSIFPGQMVIGTDAKKRLVEDKDFSLQSPGSSLNDDASKPASANLLGMKDHQPPALEERRLADEPVSRNPSGIMTPSFNQQFQRVAAHHRPRYIRPIANQHEPDIQVLGFPLGDQAAKQTARAAASRGRNPGQNRQG